jgi:hypothetical protein
MRCMRCMSFLLLSVRLSASVSLCVSLCLRSCVSPCLRSCVSPCLRSCVSPCLRSCVSPCLRSCVSPCLQSCVACVTCMALVAAFSVSHLCRFSHSKARSRRRRKGGAARSRQRRSKRSGPSTRVLSVLRRRSRTRGSSSGCWLPWPPLSFPIGSVPTCVRPSVRPAFFSPQ